MANPFRAALATLSSLSHEGSERARMLSPGTPRGKTALLQPFACSIPVSREAWEVCSGEQGAEQKLASLQSGSNSVLGSRSRLRRPCLLSDQAVFPLALSGRPAPAGIFLPEPRRTSGAGVRLTLGSPYLSEVEAGPSWMITLCPGGRFTIRWVDGAVSQAVCADGSHPFSG